MMFECLSPNVWTMSQLVTIQSTGVRTMRKLLPSLQDNWVSTNQQWCLIRVTVYFWWVLNINLIQKVEYFFSFNWNILLYFQTNKSTKTLQTSRTHSCFTRTFVVTVAPPFNFFGMWFSVCLDVSAGRSLLYLQRQCDVWCVLLTLTREWQRRKTCGLSLHNNAVKNKTQQKKNCPETNW